MPKQTIHLDTTQEVKEILDEEAARVAATTPGLHTASFPDVPGQLYYTSQLRSIGLHVETDEQYFVALSGKLSTFKRFEELLRDDATTIGVLFSELQRLARKFPGAASTVWAVGQKIILEYHGGLPQHKTAIPAKFVKPESAKATLERIVNSFIDCVPLSQVEKLVRIAHKVYNVPPAEVQEALFLGTLMAKRNN